MNILAVGDIVGSSGVKELSVKWRICRRKIQRKVYII